MSSFTNTNTLPVYTETNNITMDYLVNPTNIWAPLDGEYFGRPTRQAIQPLGAIGAGRPTECIIPDHLLPVPTLSTVSPTDSMFPSFIWETNHKREMDLKVLRQKLTAILPSPKAATSSPTSDDFCHSDSEVFDENEPPVMTYHDEEDSDTSDDIVPPPVSRVNRRPFGILFVERPATRRISRESGYTNSPPSEEVQRAILGPKPTTFERPHIASSQGPWEAGIPRRQICRATSALSAKAALHIDPWIANSTHKPPEKVAVNPVETAADLLYDILSTGCRRNGEEELFPHPPFLPSPIDSDFFDSRLLTGRPFGSPMTPHRQALLDILNTR